MTRTARIAIPLALLALAACDRGEGEASARPAPADGAPAAPPPAAAHSWRSNPGGGVDVAAAGDSLRVETGPHAILWDANGQELAPPYSVRARVQKHAGRLHEGYGLLFGGSGLEAPEGVQVYSYFLVRGDGSFLVKRRQGRETPVVRDWTAHPAIRRDGEGGGRPHELEVRVGEAEVVFLVNGAEVARVPAAELSVRGLAGLRVAHDITLSVDGFRAEPGAPAAPGGAR